MSHDGTMDQNEVVESSRHGTLLLCLLRKCDRARLRTGVEVLGGLDIGISGGSETLQESIYKHIIRKQSSHGQHYNKILQPSSLCPFSQRDGGLLP